jgi:hypothetical protein
MASFSKVKLVHFVAMMAVAIAATGCSSSEEKAKWEKERSDAEAKAEYKKTHPEVTVIGTFDGCEVKFYERGYTSENFYIAKCVNAEKTSTVSSFDRVGGKFSHDVEKFAVTKEISAMQAEKEKMDKAIAEAKAKAEDAAKKQALIDNAKKKLSVEEREALNIK